jgi:hypothetical protein
MRFDWKTTLCLSGFSLLFSPLAQAQFCQLTNASLTGSYGYVASESGTVPTTATGTTGTTATGTTTTGTTTTGTTGTTGTPGATTTTTYSNTGVGNLLGGIAAGDLFAYSGVWVFDGSGDIFATAMPGGAETPVGTYNVNSDCSVSVSLRDPFGTNTTAMTQFAGIVLGRGSEIELTSASRLQSATGTSTTTTGTGTTTNAGTTTGSTSTTTTSTGLTIQLVRVLYNNGCSDSNLSGLYGFVLNPIPMQNTSTSNTGTTTGSGTTTGTGTTTTGSTGTTTTGTGTTSTTSSEPVTVIGYLDFNGAGQIVSPSGLGGSSTSTTSSSSGSVTFSALQYTGTYSVNADCSGTLTINNSSTASTTSGTGTTTTGTTTTGTSTTGSTTTSGSAATQSITINFVITPPSAPVGGLNSSNGTPGLVLSYSQGDVSGSGYALSQ